MKSKIVAYVALICIIFYGCTKESGTVSSLTTPSAAGQGGAYPNGMGLGSMARFSGPDYSQSIPVDSANGMIGSYLSSVGYPSTDTAIRSLSFDADTLRAYLQNSNIVTLKFMIAHRPEYRALRNGKYAGMSPAALTVVVVGQDNDDNYILNKRNEVYEHLYPCPNYCGGSSSALIY